MDTTAILRTIRARLACAAQMDALAADLEARQARYPWPSWTETIEARRLRRRAADLRAGLI